MYICCTNDKNEWVKVISARVEQYNVEYVLGGDCLRRYEELESIILNQKLCIVLIDESFLHDTEALVEISIIRRLYERKKIYVEAFLWGVESDRLPHWLEWIRNVEVSLVNSVAQCALIADKLAHKYWKRRCNTESSFIDIVKKQYKNDVFLKKSVNVLTATRNRCDTGYITAIYLAGLYIHQSMNNQLFSIQGKACIDNLLEQILVGEPVNLERIRIMELCILENLIK